MLKLHFGNDWLRRKIASDPDVETEAGPSLVGSRRFGPDPNREPEPDNWKIPPIETRPRQPFFTIRGNPMSYSFAITGASKAEAAAKVASEFDQVVANQPSHATDKDGAVAAANAFINLLREPRENAA